MDELQTWRTLLGELIKDPCELERIAQALNVHSVTLRRWAKGKGHPRPQHLHRLPDAIPRYAPLLRSLLAEEARGRSEEPLFSDEDGSELPSTLYARILTMFADIPMQSLFWSICTFVLEHALQHLDPRRLGMAISVLQCTFPSKGNLVRSLHVRVARGTPPWTENILHRLLFFGAESLSGYVASTWRAAVVADTEAKDERLPFKPLEGVRSLAAYPIRHLGRLAGCLSVTSTQPHFFTPASSMRLKRYADALALAFNGETLYGPEQIAFGVMPPIPTQLLYFSHFQQRVKCIIIEAGKRGHYLSWNQGVQVALQQLEEEFLHLPCSREE